MKRLLDVLVSGSALLLIAIPGLIILSILRLTGEGKVFFLQPRVGKNREIFNVYKLVTMRENSENTGTQDITVRGDPRVLPFGRFLRKTKFNEVPQLMNVFLGHMSLVGWRPLMPKSFEMYPEHVQEKIANIKPGLTGIGSIVFRDEEEILEKTHKELRDCYVEDIAPYKGKVELWYQENQSTLLDLKILVCTVIVVLFPKTDYRKFFKTLPALDPKGEIYRIRNKVADTPSNSSREIA